MTNKYIPSQEPVQISESNPLSQHYVGETLATESNANNDTYYYYVDAAGYRYFSFQLELGCDSGFVDGYIEGSCQDDGSAPADCSYIDITQTLFNIDSLQAAGTTASDIWIIDTPLPVKYLRIKILAGAGSNSGDWTIYHRRMY